MTPQVRSMWYGPGAEPSSGWLTRKAEEWPGISISGTTRMPRSRA